LVFQVRALTDADKALAMRERAAAHGFKLPQDVCDYVLRHGQRDLPSLIALVDMLDRHSLETHRAVTLPLVRAVMRLTTEHMRSTQ
jgi:DnaA family protein